MCASAQLSFKCVMAGKPNCTYRFPWPAIYVMQISIPFTEVLWWDEAEKVIVIVYGTLD